MVPLVRGDFLLHHFVTTAFGHWLLNTCHSQAIRFPSFALSASFMILKRFPLNSLSFLAATHWKESLVIKTKVPLARGKVVDNHNNNKHNNIINIDS